MTEDLEQQPQSYEEFTAGLDITADQASAIQTIFATYQPQIADTLARHESALDQLNSFLTPTASNTLIVRARNEVVALERQIYDLLFERNMAVREVLNVEQRGQINQLLRSLLDLGATPPVVAFPYDLIGQDASTVIRQLQSAGWDLRTRTPSSAQLDRNGQQLDLEISVDSQVDDVFLR